MFAIVQFVLNCLFVLSYIIKAKHFISDYIICVVVVPFLFLLILFLFNITLDGLCHIFYCFFNFV